MRPPKASPEPAKMRGIFNNPGLPWGCLHQLNKSLKVTEPWSLTFCKPALKTQELLKSMDGQECLNFLKPFKYWETTSLVLLVVLRTTPDEVQGFIGSVIGNSTW